MVSSQHQWLWCVVNGAQRVVSSLPDLPDGSHCQEVMKLMVITKCVLISTKQTLSTLATDQVWSVLDDKRYITKNASAC